MQALSSLVSISSGLPVTSLQADLQPVTDFEVIPDGGSLLVGSPDFDEHGFFRDGGGRIAWLTRQDRERYALEPESDLLYLTKGLTHGACLPPERPYPVIATNSFVRLRVRRSGILPAYLVAYINSGPARRFGESRITGDIMPSISLKDLAQMPVPVPPIREQQLIVRLTELRRDSVRLTAELGRLYDQLAQGSINRITYLKYQTQ